MNFGGPFYGVVTNHREKTFEPLRLAVVNQALAVAESEQALAIEGSNVIFIKVPALGTFPTLAKPPFQTDKPPT